MRTKALLFAALALALAGCGSAPSTPLGHALAALKAGDRDAFLTAKAEADAALKAGWQPGDDPCKAQPVDFEHHGEAALIDKLDHPDLFKLPDEQRFVYVAHVAGKWAAPMAEGMVWSQGAGIMEVTFATVTKRLQSDCDQQAIMQRLIFYGQAPSEAERIAVLSDWKDELHTRYGDDAGFETHMRDANAALDRNGFTGQYPIFLQLNGSDDGETADTFADVQRKLNGR
jgi:hypothetical protein